MKISSWARAMVLISQLGFSMITPILICTIVGAFLDDTLGTSPWIMIVLLLLGVGGAFRNLFYMVGKEIKKGEKDE